LKNLFIVAPHFPPSSAPPSQRVRLLVKHCSSFGFFPTVFTVAPKYREEIEDAWMCTLLGKDFEEIQVNCLDFRKTRKFGIGDLGLRMIPSLFFALKKEAKKKKPAFILYPVPPWYILVIAPIIKKITGVKYGIDFIDPWVHEEPGSLQGFKHRLAQRVARMLEGWVTQNADIIFSVSEGINDNLRKRHKKLSVKPMYAVPYGAEPGDFSELNNTVSNNVSGKTVIRYIGAIWNDCYPVLDGLMPALAAVHNTLPVQLEFYGTSYGGEGHAKPQLQNWISRHDMQAYTSEQCLRVTYKEALQLTMTADMLFLVGGMQPYYAASKLMGMVVSGKPFIAFVHKDSFPAFFLKKLNYQYLVTYSGDGAELPVTKTEALKNMFVKLIQQKDSFTALDTNHPLIKENTAAGMTKFFIDKISSTL
jgi:hypothetical protein